VHGDLACTETDPPLIGFRASRKFLEHTVGGELYELWQENEEYGTLESKYVQDRTKPLQTRLSLIEYP
jgi:hypothetical protein